MPKTHHDSATQKRTQTVIFRLTPAEYNRLQDAAEHAGLTVNELARSFARTPSGRITIKQSKQLDPAAIAQLKKIGNNLNQMVKNSHIFGRPSENLDHLCDEIRTLVMNATQGE